MTAYTFTYQLLKKSKIKYADSFPSAATNRRKHHLLKVVQADLCVPPVMKWLKAGDVLRTHVHNQ